MHVSIDSQEIHGMYKVMSAAWSDRLTWTGYPKKSKPASFGTD